MSVQAMAWAIDLREPKLQPTTKLVLLLLANRSNPDNNESCWPSRRTIAAEAGIQPAAVSKHLRKLEDEGLVSRVRRVRGDGSQTSNLYRVNRPGAGGVLPGDKGGAPTGAGGVPPPDKGGSTQGITHEPKGEPKGERKDLTSDAPSDPEVSETVQSLTGEFVDAVKSNGFNPPKPDQQTYRNWLSDMDRLVRLGPPGGEPDPQDPSEIRRVVAFATTDDFWRANIGSPSKLRKQYPQLRLRMLNTRKASGPAAAVGEFPEGEVRF